MRQLSLNRKIMIVHRIRLVIDALQGLSFEHMSQSTSITWPLMDKDQCDGEQLFAVREIRRIHPLIDRDVSADE